jgi:hypothetical protein
MENLAVSASASWIPSKQKLLDLGNASVEYGWRAGTATTDFAYRASASLPSAPDAATAISSFFSAGGYWGSDVTTRAVAAITIYGVWGLETGYAGAAGIIDDTRAATSDAWRFVRRHDAELIGGSIIVGSTLGAAYGCQAAVLPFSPGAAAIAEKGCRRGGSIAGVYAARYTLQYLGRDLDDARLEDLRDLALDLTWEGALQRVVQSDPVQQVSKQLAAKVEAQITDMFPVSPQKPVD